MFFSYSQSTRLPLLISSVGSVLLLRDIFYGRTVRSAPRSVVIKKAIYHRFCVLHRFGNLMV